MNIFGHEDTRTETEKIMDERYSKLLNEYEKKFNEELNTETIPFSREEFIEILDNCLKENESINKFYPGINYLKYDCDY